MTDTPFLILMELHLARGGALSTKNRRKTKYIICQAVVSPKGKNEVE